MSETPPRRTPSRAALTYLSLGAGVQSSALLVALALGDLAPKPEYALFADTGDEPAWVYRQLDWCGRFAYDHGITLRVVTGPTLSGHLRAAANGSKESLTPIPAFVERDGKLSMMHRQCSRHFKIDRLTKAVRALLGVPKGGRVKGTVDALIGISVDEAIRAKPSPLPWVRNRWPLLDAGWTRANCASYLRDKDVPVPRRSACVFCPFHSDKEWRELQTEAPDDFRAAVVLERDIADLANVKGRGGCGPLRLHRSGRPLGEVDFLRWRDVPGQGHLFDLDGFGNECEGLCGV